MLLLKKVLGVPAPDQVSGLYAPNTSFFHLMGTGTTSISISQPAMGLH